MPAPMSLDLRQRIVHAVERGGSIREAARRFAVSRSAAIKLMQRVRTAGSPAPARFGGHRRALLGPHANDLRRLAEGRAGHHAGRAPGGAAAPVRCRRRSHDDPQRAPPDWPAASKKSLRAAERDRPDVAAGRRRRRGWQRFMDASRFVFLDATATATNMTRRYGRSPSEQRPVAAVPHGHWKTTTFLAGLRRSGVAAPPVLAGPLTGTAFRACVEQFLAPALEPGAVVVLDNLAAHKVDGVRQAIAKAGAAILHPPPYGPDPNPIEQLFAKLKALLRKAAARTKDELWSTIGHLLETRPATECANYLRHSGSGST